MPEPLPRLHSPHSVACDSLEHFLELSHQAFTITSRHAGSACKMNVRKLLESLPQRERDSGGEFVSDCKIRARKMYDRHTGREVMVFKRVGAGRRKEPCGMPDCPKCGIFWGKYTFVVGLCSYKQPYLSLGVRSRLTVTRDVRRRSRERSTESCFRSAFRFECAQGNACIICSLDHRLYCAISSLYAYIGRLQQRPGMSQRPYARHNIDIDLDRSH